MAASVAAARDAYARRDWRAVYDGLHDVARPARHRRPRPRSATPPGGSATAPRRWRSPRTSTSGSSPRARPRGGGRPRPAAGPRLGDPRRPAGRHRLAHPGRPAAPRPAALLRARRPAPTSTAPSTSTWPPTRRRRRRRRSRSRALAEELDDPTLGCFALTLDGHGRGPPRRDRRRLRAPRRGDAARARRPRRRAVGRRHLLHRRSTSATASPTWPGCADWTEALARWANPLSQHVHVRRRHPRPRAADHQRRGRLGRRGGGARPRRATSLVGAHGWLSGTGFYELGEVRRLRGDRAGARAAYDRARASGIDPQPGAALLLRAAGDAEAPWPSCASRSPSRAGSAARGSAPAGGRAGAGDRRPGVRRRP